MKSDSIVVKMEKILSALIILKILNMSVGTCVLESEFGFNINCNFRKSGLFRVRNLGGLKAHFGLGFSLGDELGFSESIGNLEGNRRREISYKYGFNNKIGVISSSRNSSSLRLRQPYSVPQKLSSMTEIMYLPLGVPTFKPLPINEKKMSVILDDTSIRRKVDLNHTTEAYNPKEEEYNFTFNILTKNQGDDSKDIQNNYKAENNNTKNISSYKTYSTLGIQRNIKLVMNAPKEYYPSGYDKNYDDNFKSKVNLPPTDFACTDQKYFPGLYANIELGCMVFHVCAITEGGLIMKSFLCPESTLFDQSILKCNWWFYVDCDKSSYDTNIPISKSYQLMKSLTYFSNMTNS